MTRALFVTLILLSSVTITGQEFHEGTWSGTLTRVNTTNPRPNRQKFALEFKKSPDPHWAWRPGSTEAWSVTVIAPGGRSQATDFRLAGDVLSFRYRRGDSDITCRLTQQPDATFEGDCVSDEEGGFRLSLTPAKAAAK
jgi:hypothetical protein